MKLIIDIDEKLYEQAIKDAKIGYGGSDVWIAVGNGTPYNPSGDAISREALKKILSEPLYRSTIKDYGEILKYTFVIDMINNAPILPLPDFKAGYKQAIIDGKANYSRQKGEYISVDTLFVKCSICGNLTRVLKKYNMPNFCPACGADMRKGGKE